MALTVDALREKFPPPGGEFTLSASELDLPPAVDLFTAYLGSGTLTVTDVQDIDTTALSFSGSIVFADASRTGTVEFFADPSGVDVTGFRADAGLTGWVLPAAWDGADLTFLHDWQPDITGLALALSIEPIWGGIEGTGNAGIGAWLAVSWDPSHLLYLRGFPVPGSAGVSAGVQLIADGAPGITLPNTSDLPEITPRPPESAFGTPGITPVLPLALTDLAYTLAPAAPGSITVSWSEVRIADSLTLIPGLFELNDIRARYSVRGTDVDTALVTGMTLGGARWNAGLQLARNGTVASVQSMDIRLADTIRLSAIWEALGLAGAGLPDLEIKELACWLDVPTRGYGMQIDLTGAWQIIPSFSLNAVQIEAAGTDAPPDQVDVLTLWMIGKAAVRLSALYTAGQSWQFSGELIPGYTLSISDFDTVLADVFSAQVPAPVASLTLRGLALAFDSEGEHFEFAVSGAFPLAGVTAGLTVTAALDHNEADGYDPSFTGVLTLPYTSSVTGQESVLNFTVAFAQDATSTVFTASAEADPGVSFADLAKVFGLDLSGIPEAFVPVLTQIGCAYDSARGLLVVTGATQSVQAVFTAARGTDGSFAYAGLINATVSVRLSDLPLLAGLIPDSADLGLTGVQTVAAAQDLTADQISGFNSMISAFGSQWPLFPAQELPAGLVVSVFYTVAGTPQPAMVAAFTTGDTEPPADPVPGAVAGTAVPLVLWVPIQRSFGPISVQRLGLGYADPDVWVLIDGVLRVDGLAVAVQGLGIGFPLTSDTVVPSFRLDGLGVDFRRPPVEIGGALVTMTPDDGYDLSVGGALALSTRRFSARAVGMYEHPVAGSPLLFVFARASVAAVGPAPFVLTGFAAGFGMNGAVRVPDRTEVADFPLLNPEVWSTSGGTPLSVLTSLIQGSDPWITPRPGEIWLAAGADFTSFQWIRSRALVLLEFGDEFTLALLGLGEATFPQNAAVDQAYAKVGLQLEAVYRQSQARLAISADLTPDSFLIDRACVLSGGFAFFLWFDGSGHAGDFVMTAGGYHPAFRVPAWYPVLPRVGFSWTVDSTVTVSGKAYAALTPGAVMAGGALDVVFHTGGLRAWFTAHADLLLQWAPFAFDVAVGVTVGVSYRIDWWFIHTTLKVELGAEVHLFGPPTGGTVTVHLWFLSFTVSFGAAKAAPPPPVDWAAFLALLPPSPVALTPVAGLLPADADTVSAWRVSPAGFTFTTQSAAPVTTAVFCGATAATGEPVDVRPMGLSAIASTQTVTVTTGGQTPDVSSWQVSAVSGSVPAALWGPPGPPQVPDPGQQLLARTTGLEITVPPPVPGFSPGPVAESLLAATDLEPEAACPLTPGAPAPEPSPVDTPGTAALIGTEIAAGTAVTARTSLYDALGALGRSPGPGADGTLDTYAAETGAVLLDDPLLLPAP